MSQAIDVVNRFFKAWEPSMGFRSALREFMTDDCVYENVGLTLSKGPEESAAVLQGFVDQMGFDHLKVKMVAIAANGDTVLTERVDDLHDASGKLLISLRVMGTLEVRNGRIAAWRDYFDTVPFRG